MKQIIKRLATNITAGLLLLGVNAQSNITKAKYYSNDDPGYSKASTHRSTASPKPANFMQAQDSSYALGHDTSRLFAEPYANGNTSAASAIPALKRTEYYIDTDPGYGKGIQVAQESVSNLNNINVSINISGLSKGSHTLYVRSRDANNAWSLDNKWDFQVGTAVTGAAIMVNSVSKKTICSGTTLLVGYDAKGTYNTGNKFTVQLSNGTGSFTSPTAIGSVTSTVLNGVITCTVPASLATGAAYKVRVISTNEAVTGTPGVDALTISASPAVPTITPGGPTTFCQGGNVKLTSSSATSYLWSSGATTKSITVNAKGSYTVTVANSNGCHQTSAATAVTVNANPVPATTPAGNVTINQGSSVTISVNTTYSSYLWSTGAITKSITTSKAGSYTVTVTNASGCSGTSAPVKVTVKSGCTKPTITAGGSTTDVCPGKTVKLTSSNASSYLWNTGATTKSVTVNAAGSYTVTTGDGCTSDPVVVTYADCADPTGLAVKSITAKSAKLSWTGSPCATKYTVQYRKSGTAAWTQQIITTASLSITGLTAGTQYQWNVTATCSSTSKSAKVTGPKFTTASTIISAKAEDMQNGQFSVSLFPNPAQDKAILQISGAKDKVFIIITDINGKYLWQSGGVNSSQIQLPVGSLSNGTYLVQITSGNKTKTLTLVKTK